MTAPHPLSYQSIFTSIQNQTPPPLSRNAFPQGVLDLLQQTIQKAQATKALPHQLYLYKKVLLEDLGKLEIAVIRIRHHLTDLDLYTKMLPYYKDDPERSKLENSCKECEKKVKEAEESAFILQPHLVKILILMGVIEEAAKRFETLGGKIIFKSKYFVPLTDNEIKKVIDALPSPDNTALFDLFQRTIGAKALEDLQTII